VASFPSCHPHFEHQVVLSDFPRNFLGMNVSQTVSQSSTEASMGYNGGAQCILGEEGFGRSVESNQ
jgi:hypothetical protein